jgi:hypothetical protein
MSGAEASRPNRPSSKGKHCATNPKLASRSSNHAALLHCAVLDTTSLSSVQCRSRDGSYHLWGRTVLHCLQLEDIAAVWQSPNLTDGVQGVSISLLSSLSALCLCSLLNWTLVRRQQIASSCLYQPVKERPGKHETAQASKHLAQPHVPQRSVEVLARLPIRLEREQQ